MNEPQPSKTIPIWIYAAICLTAALSLFSIYRRFRVESRNKATTIVAEYEAVESLAGSEGLSVEQALRLLKEKGLGGVVLTEETVSDLVSSGKVSPRAGMLTTSDPTARARLIRGLGIRFGKVGQHTIDPRTVSVESFPRVNIGLERATAVGINPSQSALARRLHLAVIARCANPPGVTPKAIDQTLSWAHELGATLFMPLGDQVLGRRDALGTTVSSLTGLGMLYATPEFSKIGGDSNMIEDAPELTVRLHTAQSSELDKLPMKEAVDRFARAARERNMRVLMVRPISYGAERPIDDFGEFVFEIGKEIKAQGGSLGTAKGFTDPGISKVLFVLIGLSLAPIFYFVASTLVAKRNVALVWAALVALAGIACYAETPRQYVALFATLLLPPTAFLLLDLRRGKSILLEFFVTVGTSVVGGLVVAGLLNGIPYYITAKAFPGVKLSVFLPIALVGIYFFARLTQPAEKLRGAVTWRGLAIGLCFVAALGLMWARTGNDNPAAVSSWELKVRDILDVLLFVRPRTKAFLVGFPLLVIGIGMLMRYRSGQSTSANYGAWTALALTGGAIGATDVVNTLCHLHTPVLLSLLRILVGAMVGCILGMVAWGLMGRKRPAAEA